MILRRYIYPGQIYPRYFAFIYGIKKIQLLLIDIFLNFLLIVVSKSCTKRKTNSRQKLCLFKIKFYPSPKKLYTGMPVMPVTNSRSAYITILEFDPWWVPTVIKRSTLEVTILEIDNYGTNCRACSYFTTDPLSYHVTDTSSTVNVFFWIKDIKANSKAALQTLQLPIFFY